MNHNFKNLKIWNLAMEITSDIHTICLEFPKNETYGLVSQMNYIPTEKTNELENKIIKLQKMIADSSLN